MASVSIESPFHGAVLNHRLGTQTGEELIIQVEGRAGLLDQVTVNGAPAQRAGERFSAPIALRELETDIIAEARGGGGVARHHVRVVWDKNSRPRYRFSIDDNVYFLRDIARQGYASLFDCFYLDGLRDLHRRHGAKFTVNIYFTDGEGFELPQFPDRYRSEWHDNADWLKLAFHAWSNDPPRPYEYAAPTQLAHDLDAVNEEIVRFAGEQTLAPPTVIHFAMLPPSCLPTLAERGVRVLSGIFRRAGRRWDINYKLDDERSAYLWQHDALKDFASGIVFSRVDIICNNTPLEQTAPLLQSLSDRPETAEIMDLFTHEQYFWPFYERHVPDHFERLDAAIAWVTEHGYEPVWFHEGFLGM